MENWENVNQKQEEVNVVQLYTLLACPFNRNITIHSLVFCDSFCLWRIQALPQVQ